jgi:hypothetical protein
MFINQNNNIMLTIQLNNAIVLIMYCLLKINIDL